MNDMFNKNRLVLNQNNTWVRLMLWFNSFGAVVNLISLAISCALITVGLNYFTAICTFIVMGINFYFKCVVLAGTEKVCEIFNTDYIKPINILDMASFILGYLTLLIVGWLSESMFILIKIIIILFIASILYITSLENLHKLFLEIKLHKKYNWKKDIKFDLLNKATAYDVDKIICDDIAEYYIRCEERSNCYELYILSSTLGIRRRLLLINVSDRDNADIHDINQYETITEIRVGKNIIDMDNIKDYL